MVSQLLTLMDGIKGRGQARADRAVHRRGLCKALWECSPPIDSSWDPNKDHLIFGSVWSESVGRGRPPCLRAARCANSSALAGGGHRGHEPPEHH